MVLSHTYSELKYVKADTSKSTDVMGKGLNPLFYIHVKAFVLSHNNNYNNRSVLKFLIFLELTQKFSELQYRMCSSSTVTVSLTVF